MTERIIAIADHRSVAPVPALDSGPPPSDGIRRDALDRPLQDLRVSVTDRCNFRCTYCMPKSVFGKDHVFLPQPELLSFEEIRRAVRIFIDLGITKVRLTGGEPLLRRGIEELIAMLAALRTRDGGPLDLTLTTNGSLLRRKARTLRQAGLTRLTVSLDALDDTVFRAMNDVDFPVADVLAGIDAAAQAGFSDIKINMVVRRGVNDQEVLPMARHFRHSGQVLRFIEFMDVGSTNGWRMNEVLPSAELLQRIDAGFPVEPLSPNYPGEVAERWRYRDGGGEIGVISSVSQPFCASCTRARLSTDGRLYTCLFADTGHDLRTLLRGTCSDQEIAGAVAGVWRRRADRYSAQRTAATSRSGRVEMSYIGG